MLNINYYQKGPMKFRQFVKCMEEFHLKFSCVLCVGVSGSVHNE